MRGVPADRNATYGASARTIRAFRPDASRKSFFSNILQSCVDTMVSPATDVAAAATAVGLPSPS